MDHLWLAKNIKKIKILFIFHKEFMFYVMDMVRMVKWYRILLHKLYIVYFFYYMTLDSLLQCLEENKIDSTVI